MNYLNLSNIGKSIDEPRGRQWDFRHPDSDYIMSRDWDVRTGKLNVDVTYVHFEDKGNNDIVVRCSSKRSKCTYYFLIDCSGNYVGDTIIGIKVRDGKPGKITSYRLFDVEGEHNMSNFRNWILEVGRGYHMDKGCPRVWDMRERKIKLPESYYEFETPFSRGIRITDFIC